MADLAPDRRHHRHQDRPHDSIIPLPGWLARVNQRIAQPFSASAAGVFALPGFVAAYQPHRDSAPVVQRLGLPPQLTVADYLDLNYQPHGNR